MREESEAACGVKALSSFTLVPLVHRKPEAPPRARLLHEGQDTERDLPGAVLEGQFEVDERYLLLVTDDLPYEEILRFYLLDRSFAVLDELKLGAPYTPGIVKDLEITGEQELELSFPGEDRWCLRVHSPARRLLSAQGFRGLLGKRHLELSRREEDPL